MHGVLDLLATDEGHEGEALPVLPLQLFQHLFVGDIAPVPHGIDQHDVLETLPGLWRAQERQEGRHARAGGQQPQVASRWHLVQGEAALGRLLHPHSVARVQARQLR